MKRISTNALAWACICFATAFYVIANFQNYNKPYYPDYVLDLYSQSQWSVPEATRSIGDDGLYQAAALHMLYTGKIAEINFEAPPVGKYLIFSSLLIFSSPYFIFPFIYAICAIMVWKIASLITEPTTAFIALLLFLFEPMIGLQASTTLLDLPQLCWLLWHILCINAVVKADSFKKTIPAIIGAGITLGLFAATKFGVISAVVIACDLWLLLMQKRFRTIFLLFPIAVGTYALAFLPYILQEGLFKWLQLERNRIYFYSQSFTSYIPGSGLLSLFVPWSFTWWKDGIQFIKEWNLLWPLSVVAIGLSLRDEAKNMLTKTRDQFKKTKQIDTPKYQWQSVPATTIVKSNDALQYAQQYIILLASGTLLTSVLIPFWPRYLTLVLPFGLILLAQYTRQLSLRLTPTKCTQVVAGFIIIQVISISAIITPSVSAISDIYGEWFRHSLYKDLYYASSNYARLGRDSEEFWKGLLNVEQTLQVRAKKASIQTQPITLPWELMRRSELVVEYETPIGIVKHTAPITLQRDFNTWKIVWDWSFILPEYQPSDRITFTRNVADSCKVLTEDNRVAATFEEWPTLYVLPTSLDKHPDKKTLYVEMYYLTGLNEAEINNRLRSNNPPDVYARVAPMLDEYNTSKLESLLLTSGFDTREEVHWTIQKDLSPQQKKDTQTVTTTEKLDRTFISGTITRQKVQTKNAEILLENTETNETCRYTI